MVDKQIAALIREYKKLTGKHKTIGYNLTKEEEIEYEKLNIDELKDRLLNAEPGEAPLIESLDAEHGKVIYMISHGRRTRSLEELCYQKVNGKWQKKFRT